MDGLGFIFSYWKYMGSNGINAKVTFLEEIFWILKRTFDIRLGMRIFDLGFNGTYTIYTPQEVICWETTK